jgi:transcriptional regulator with XRE-family HTH domain
VAKRTLPTNGMHAQMLRMTRGMTQEQLAEKSGVGRRKITDIENGNGAEFWLLTEVAKALGVSVEELVPSFVSLPGAPPSPPHEEKITFNMSFSVDAKAFDADKVAQLLKHLKELFGGSRDIEVRQVKAGSLVVTGDMFSDDFPDLLYAFADGDLETLELSSLLIPPKYAAEVLTLLKASGLLTEYEWDPFRHFRTPERLLAFFGPKTRSKARYHKSKYRPRRREPPLLIELQADRSIKIRRRPRHEERIGFPRPTPKSPKDSDGTKGKFSKPTSRSNTRGRSDAFSR